MHLDALLFTHPHKDHVAGMDDIRAYNFFSDKPMDVYANELTQNALRKEFSYIFTENKYPGLPKVEMNLITEEPFMIGDIPVTPIVVMHLKMPVYGYRFGDFTYITDANHIENSELEKIKGSKGLVLNALRKEKHISHFNLPEAVSLSQDLQVPNTYLTHLSHQMGRHEEVNNELPKGIHLAWDGLTLEY